MLLTTAFYVGVCALLMVALSANVSRLRFKHRAPNGYGNAKTGEVLELRRASRAHGNFIENTPLLLLILAAMEAGGAGSTQIHVFGAAIILTRLGHAVALLNGGPFVLRAGSVLANWALFVIGGLILVARGV